MKITWMSTLVVIAAFAIPSCTKEPDKKADAGNPGTDQSQQVTYEGFVKGWLEEKCTSCHDSDGDEPDLTTYDKAKKNGKAILASIQDEENPMPKGGKLPPKATVDKIKSWVNAGMPKSGSGGTKTGKGNSGSDSDSDPDSGASLITWDDWMKGWLDDNCNSCHKAGGPNEPDLSTYDKAKAQIDAILDSIQNADNPMPPLPKGLPKDEVVEKVQAWKDADMPKSEASGGSGTGSGTDTGGGTGTGGGTATGGTATGGGGTGTGTGNSATGVTYESFVRNWLSQNCTSCHKPGATPPDLSTYQTAKAGAQRSLARSTGKDPKGIMPPGAQAQPADVLSKLESWISGGTKEK